MIHKTILLIGVVTVMTLDISLAQAPNIIFVQDDTITLNKGASGYFEMSLKGKPFTIIFEGDQLHVSTGLNKEMFQKAKADTDINKDFNSNFYIFKYPAMPKDADYLSIREGNALSLNESHGAKPIGENMHKYTVRTLWEDDEELPLSEFKKFYLACWLDANKDQYIDKEELLWIQANIN